ncbi:MAG: iron-containing alcohol dehydrogenase, partial [Acidobacteria bacterium]
MTLLDLNQLTQTARSQGLTVPGRVVFGDGKISELPDWLASLGAAKDVFLVFGHTHAENTGLREQVEQSLIRNGFQVVGRFQVQGEPTADMVDAAAAMCREQKGQVIIGCGGGSVIDCAKAVAAMATNPGGVREYLEGVGRSTLTARPLPVVAAPTTAGTGSEATRNAVLSVTELGIKRSLRHPALVPQVALLDPELTWTSSPAVTAASGMDALTQMIESCITVKRHPETTLLALVGLSPIRTALRACYRNPKSREARAAMAQSAFLSGVCLANSGLGLVHGIASGLGAVKGLAHGFICAVLLPHALRLNRAAAEVELTEALSAFLHEPANPGTIEKGIKEIEDLKKDLGLPSDLR